MSNERKYNASLISGFKFIRQAMVCFDDWGREVRGGIGEKIAKKYVEKLAWFKKDFITIPHFSEPIRNAIREEFSSDEFMPDAIFEKIMLLDPTKRELIEATIDALLAGEEIQIVDNKKEVY